LRKFVFAVLLIFSVFVLTNCSQPIGTTEGGSRESGKYIEGSMWLVPKRLLYQIDERYKRYEDFQIFAVIDGGVVEISTSDSNVKVLITVNKDLSTERVYKDEEISAFLQFHYVGRHIVAVNYLERKGDYSVEVFSPNNGNSIGGDEGIGIIWLK
jgi:hypothetical protein